MTSMAILYRSGGDRHGALLSNFTRTPFGNNATLEHVASLPADCGGSHQLEKLAVLRAWLAPLEDPNAWSPACSCLAEKRYQGKLVHCGWQGERLPELRLQVERRKCKLGGLVFGESRAPRLRNNTRTSLPMRNASTGQQTLANMAFKAAPSTTATSASVPHLHKRCKSTPSGNFSAAQADRSVRHVLPGGLPWHR